MNKSSLEQLTMLAKASTIGRMDGTTVNMTSPASVSQAKTATRVRAQKIRAASPTIKSTNKKHTCSKSCGCAKPYVKSAIKKKSADAGSSPEFDLDAFNREFPPELGSAGDTSLDSKVEHQVSTKRMAAPKKAPSMDAQASRMKMKSAKKSLEDYRNDLVKSLDPTILPKAGTLDRKNFETAYNAWKPKPLPADWKPLGNEEKRSLNQWAAVGHKGAIHQLMDDGHWFREQHGMNQDGQTSWGASNPKQPKIPSNKVPKIKQESDPFLAKEYSE